MMTELIVGMIAGIMVGVLAEIKGCIEERHRN